MLVQVEEFFCKLFRSPQFVGRDGKDMTAATDKEPARQAGTHEFLMRPFPRLL